jgi:hypothetical protein
MIKRLVIAITLIGLGLVLSGCSSAPSEVSPEEKRNNYDLCILNETEKATAQLIDLEASINRKLEGFDFISKLASSVLTEEENDWFSTLPEDRERFREVFLPQKIEVYCKFELE